MSDEIFGLNFPVKSFAVANQFVVNTNKACYALGQQLQPFCIYGNETQKEYGVLDFATFSGFANPEISLVSELASYRKEAYKAVGIHANIEDELKCKMLFFDYLMTISICYVEVPKWTTKDGMPIATFDKFLCTRNPAIMAAWMGIDKSEAQAKYSARIQSSQLDFNDNVLRFVKLMQSKKGNSITVPRTSYSVEKMTCIPMYMLYAFVEGFKTHIQNGIVKFSFLKDNGTIRELPTTLNEGIIRDYYSDNLFVNTMLSGIDINTVEQGGMHISSKMNRGYIKVPELGSSVYDGSGVRSLNLARLLRAEPVESVDRTFINVDLSSVEFNFQNAVEYLAKHQPNEVANCYKALTGEDTKAESIPAMVSDLVSYVSTRIMLLSTTFQRSLHVFLVSNPQWFPLYTGKKSESVVSSNNYGVSTMDF